MPKQNLKVYLDHLIRRENLLYRRENKNQLSSHTLFALNDSLSQEAIPEWSPLKLQELYGEESKTPYLRKPDFQRATWSWTATECVDLLEAVLDLQVVPSVILWKSPEGFLYVLDGGHRISVLLAWIADDWGDRRAIKHQDPGTEDIINKAAKEVRLLLVQKGIGTYKEYQEANKRFRDLNADGKNPKDLMSNRELDYANRMRHWINSNVGFPILWVRGDHVVAERSFLQINKTGQKLSEWQQKLVENRTSSFARTVMAISHNSNPEYCWTTDAPEVSSDTSLKNKIDEILLKVKQVHKILFEPPHERPIKISNQPLLVIPYTQPEKQPVYVAEVLTIVEGNKGQKAETDKLIKKDSKSTVPKIIDNGLSLINNAIDVIGNILGSTPRSLTLVPLLYFYSTQGIQVRSLLYGMLFWLSSGTEEEVRSRKILFTVHRKSFETILLRYKDSIVSRLSRRIGSGAEATLQAAKYFDGLLKLIVEIGIDDQKEFSSKHAVLLETLGKEEKVEVKPLTPGDSFSKTTKERNQINELIDNLPECGICGGLYIPGVYTQVDHIQRRRDKGTADVDNARQTHPFCNNHRDRIERLISKDESISLPVFEKQKNEPAYSQPSLFFLDDDDDESSYELEGSYFDDATTE